MRIFAPDSVPTARVMSSSDRDAMAERPEPEPQAPLRTSGQSGRLHQFGLTCARQLTMQ